MVTDVMIVFASELAAAVGRHKYKQAWEVFEALWQRQNPAQFDHLMSPSQSVKDTAAAVHKQVAELLTTATEATCAQDLVTVSSDAKVRVSAVVSKRVESVVQTNKPEAIQELVQGTTEEHVRQVAAKHGLSLDDAKVKETVQLLQTKESLENKVVSDVRCSFGTAKEEDARRRMVANGVTQSVVKHDKFHILWMDEYLTRSGKRWGIGGRVDGVDEHGRIVEIKNRARHFFNRVPPYEWVQVQAYMALLDKNEVVFVQQLHGRQNVSYVFRDRYEWDSAIIPTLYTFVDTLDMFMADESSCKREEWAISNDSEKEELLSSWMNETKSLMLF